MQTMGDRDSSAAAVAEIDVVDTSRIKESEINILCNVEDDADCETSSAMMTSQVGQPKRRSAEPPDGGYGWVIVFGCFTVNLVFGILRLTFAIYITEWVEYFDKTIGEISLLSSVDIIVSSLMAIPSGSLTKTLGARACCIIGLAVASIGLLLSSFVTDFYLLIFTFGVIKATGQGLLLIPSTVIVQQYFQKRRSLAVGLAALGRSCGPMAFAPIHRLLIDAFGWQGGLRMVAAIVTQCIVIAAALRPMAETSFRPPPGTNMPYDSADHIVMVSKVDVTSSDSEVKEYPNNNLETKTEAKRSEKATDDAIEVRTSDTLLRHQSFSGSTQQMGSSVHDKPLETKKLGLLPRLRTFCSGMAKSFELSLLREHRFWLFMLGRSLAMSAAYGMYSFTVARAVYFGVDELKAAFLVTCIGTASLLGRFNVSIFGNMTCTDRQIFYITMVSVGGAVVCLTTIAGSIVYMLGILNFVFGFTLGSHETLFQVVATDIFSLEKLPGCLGWSFAFQGIVCFAVLLVMGALFDHLGNYTIAFIMVGFIQILGGCCHMALTWMIRRSASDAERPGRKLTLISERDITVSTEAMSQ